MYTDASALVGLHMDMAMYLERAHVVVVVQVFVCEMGGERVDLQQLLSTWRACTDSQVPSDSHLLY